jgi:hypothetical protein
LFLFSLVRLNGKQKKIRELYSIFPELGLEVFEEKIKKPMELHLHANSNVISMNSLNTITANAIEKSKLGETSFYDLFSPPSTEEKICSDDTLFPICDNSNDACDPHIESIPFKIPMKIVEVFGITAILEMELSILVIIYSLYMNYASCSSVQVFQWAKLR